MKFYIPYNEKMSLEAIELDFMLKYYPEMETSNGKLFFLFFGPDYVALNKNVFVHDRFTIKHNEEKGKTIIKTQRGLNRWFDGGLPNISPFLLVNNFVSGDFYEDVNKNFKTFLLRHYGYKEEEIIIKETWREKLAKFSKFFLVWLIFVFATLLMGIVQVEFSWYSRTSFILMFGLSVITFLLTILVAVSVIRKTINYLKNKYFS